MEAATDELSLEREKQDRQGEYKRIQAMEDILNKGINVLELLIIDVLNNTQNPDKLLPKVNDCIVMFRKESNIAALAKRRVEREAGL